MLHIQSFLSALTLFVLAGVLVALVLLRLARRFSGFACLVLVELLGEVAYAAAVFHPYAAYAWLWSVLDALRLLAFIGCTYQLFRFSHAPRP